LNTGSGERRRFRDELSDGGGVLRSNDGLLDSRVDDDGAITLDGVSRV
jgi:hypothetical protein